MGKFNINLEAQQKITEYINNVDGEFHEILIHLRKILTSSEIGLKEDWKWGAPNFVIREWFAGWHLSKNMWGSIFSMAPSLLISIIFLKNNMRIELTV